MFSLVLEASSHTRCPLKCASSVSVVRSAVSIGLDSQLVLPELVCITCSLLLFLPFCIFWARSRCQALGTCLSLSSLLVLEVGCGWAAVSGHYHEKLLASCHVARVCLYGWLQYTRIVSHVRGPTAIHLTFLPSHFPVYSHA